MEESDRAYHFLPSFLFFAKVLSDAGTDIESV
jgi:hypothetical protein